MKNGLIAFKDYSVHFTLKGQTLEQIKEAFDILLMTESLVKETDDVLHHCFLPRIVVEQRGWTTEVLDFLRQINPFKRICWYRTTEGDVAYRESEKEESILRDRWTMLENLAKLKGTAFFIGAQIDGVKEEYEIAKSLGLRIIQIHILNAPYQQDEQTND